MTKDDFEKAYKGKGVKLATELKRFENHIIRLTIKGPKREV